MMLSLDFKGEGLMSARLMADIGKPDVVRFMGRMDEKFVRQFYSISFTNLKLSFCLFTQHQIQPPNNAVFRPLPLSLIHIFPLSIT